LVDMSLRRFTRKDPRLEGGGGQEEWPTGHVDGWTAAHLLQTDLDKLVETTLYPHITPPMTEDTKITLIL
jgi:hypothetical protein